MTEMTEKKTAARKILVEQYRSPIGTPRNQRATLRSLGLRRIRHRVRKPDVETIRGMVATIPHLVRIVEEPGGGAGSRRKPRPSSSAEKKG